MCFAHVIIALEYAPEHLGLRLALGERLLEACRVVDCQTLVEGLPPAAKEGHWPDVIASLIAMAEENWPWQGIIWVYWLFLINHLSIALRG